MFNFKKGFTFLLLFCVIIFAVSFVSAEEIDNEALSLEDFSGGSVNNIDSNSISDDNSLNSIDESYNSVDDEIEEKSNLLSSNSESGSVLQSNDYENFFIEPSYGTDFDEDDFQDDFVEAKLKASKITTTYKSNKYFTFKAVESGTHSPIPFALLKIRVYTGKKHKDYYIEADDRGIAKFKTSRLSVGTHKVIISDVDDFIYSHSIKSTIRINKAKTIIKAPTLTTNFKKKSYFKVTVKNKATKKVVKGLKIKIKIYSGNKYKIYTVKTNSKGVAKFKTSKLKVGTHKVLISSGNKNFYLNSKSRIVIKKSKKKSTKKSKSYSVQSGYYVGSVNSDVFHYPSCSSAKRIMSSNKITFYSRADALNSGYRPCYRCHP